MFDLDHTSDGHSRFCDWHEVSSPLNMADEISVTPPAFPRSYKRQAFPQHRGSHERTMRNAWEYGISMKVIAWFVFWIVTQYLIQDDQVATVRLSMRQIKLRLKFDELLHPHSVFESWLKFDSTCGLCKTSSFSVRLYSIFFQVTKCFSHGKAESYSVRCLVTLVCNTISPNHNIAV